MPHSGRRLIRSRRMATSSTATWVDHAQRRADAQHQQLGDCPSRTGSTESSPGTSRYRPSVAIATTLLHTGAHAGGPNTLRVLRIAMNTDDSP